MDEQKRLEKNKKISEKLGKFKSKVHCKSLVEHMSEGYSVSSWCTKQGIARSTFDNWLKKHESFQRAYKMAKAGSKVWWEDLGRELAKKGNASVYIFNMKNRHGWSDKQHHTVEAIKPALIEAFDDSEKPIKLEFKDTVETECIEVQNDEKL